MIIYPLLISLAFPVGLCAALRSLVLRKESYDDLRERFGAGLATASIRPGPVLWIHGASNGEIMGARAIIDTLSPQVENLQIIVTVNSVSARSLVTSWGIPNLTVRLAPIDLRRTTHHFISCAQPDVLLTLENEIWPNRFTQCGKNDIPVIVAGARISEKSASIWHKYRNFLKGTTRETLASIKHLAAQDEASEARFLELGFAHESLLPQMNLKSGVELSVSLPQDAQALRSAFVKQRTVLAASTHEGEDEQILDAFARAKQQHPDIKMILAPRHPKRADAIECLIEQAGLTAARRSRAEPPSGADVYLADTLGEMAHWYALAGYTFVGGSLIDKGGHTPFEPAQFGTTILHGPYTSNHSTAFDALSKSGGALEVRSATSFADTLSALLDAPDHAAKIAQTGATALAELRKPDVGSSAFWTALNSALSADSKNAN